MPEYPEGVAELGRALVDADYVFVNKRKMLASRLSTYLASSGDVLDLITSSGVNNHTSISSNVALDATSRVIVVQGVYFVGLWDQTLSGPTTTFIYFIAGGSLVPFGYNTSTQSINGAPNAIATFEPGLYLLAGDGADAWGVLPADLALKNNLTATTDPSVSDDNTNGYAPGSVWVNNTSNKVWFCGDSATGAADWQTFASAASVAAAQAAADAAQTSADDAQADATQALSDAATAQATAEARVLIMGHTATSALLVDSGGNVVDSHPSTTDRLLAFVSGAISWVQLTLGMIPDALITLAKIADQGAHTILTRAANSTGVVAAQSIGTDEGIFNVAGVLTSQKAQTANIADGAITGAKVIQSGTLDIGATSLTTTGGVTSALLKSGSGSPEGVTTAGPGALYRDTTNGKLYLKTSGAGNTGWLLLNVDGVDPLQIQIITSGTTATIGDHVRWVFVSTAAGNFTLTGAAISIGKEVEIQKTSTDANTITYGRAGSENVQTVAANFALPLSGAANYPAWTVKDADATNRYVS